MWMSTTDHKQTMEMKIWISRVYATASDNIS